MIARVIALYRRDGYAVSERPMLKGLSGLPRTPDLYAESEAPVVITVVLDRAARVLDAMAARAMARDLCGHAVLVATSFGTDALRWCGREGVETLDPSTLPAVDVEPLVEPVTEDARVVEPVAMDNPVREAEVSPVIDASAASTAIIDASAPEVMALGAAEAAPVVPAPEPAIPTFAVSTLPVLPAPEPAMLLPARAGPVAEDVSHPEATPEAPIAEDAPLAAVVASPAQEVVEIPVVTAAPATEDIVVPETPAQFATAATESELAFAADFHAFLASRTFLAEPETPPEEIVNAQTRPEPPVLPAPEVVLMTAEESTRMETAPEIEEDVSFAPLPDFLTSEAAPVAEVILAEPAAFADLPAFLTAATRWPVGACVPAFALDPVFAAFPSRWEPAPARAENVYAPLPDFLTAMTPVARDTRPPAFVRDPEFAPLAAFAPFASPPAALEFAALPDFMTAVMPVPRSARPAVVVQEPEYAAFPADWDPAPLVPVSDLLADAARAASAIAALMPEPVATPGPSPVPVLATAPESAPVVAPVAPPARALPWAIPDAATVAARARARPTRKLPWVVPATPARATSTNYQLSVASPDRWAQRERLTRMRDAIRRDEAKLLGISRPPNVVEGIKSPWLAALAQGGAREIAAGR